MRRKKYVISSLVAVAAIVGASVIQASMTIPMYMVTSDQQSKSIGSLTLDDSFSGVLITPNLHDLPPGVHGFHIHTNPDCGEHGMAAGGHLDPANTNQHDGPYNTRGHMGDLPVLLVNKDGKSTTPALAPKFKIADIRNHSLIIHAGGDNYSDSPEKMGGGGERIACGIIR